MQQPRKLGQLVGYGLQARNGEIGSLEEIYFDDDQWTVRYFVVRTGGWLLGRRVLVVPSVVTSVDETTKRLNVDLTRAQIKACPPLDTQLPVSRRYERQYYQYYGWEPYWGGDPLLAPTSLDPERARDAQTDADEYHLRSSKEATGSRIHALDGEIGYVVDLIVEEPEWLVRYLEVDTRHWLPGKRVLIGTPWISHAAWHKNVVSVDLPCEAIQTAPTYDPNKIIGRDYQAALYKHYGMKCKEAS